jgi:hypothetical protein
MVLSITSLSSQNKYEWRPLAVTERLFCQFPANPERYTEVFEIFHADVKSYDYTIIKSSDINPDFDSIIEFISFKDSLNYYSGKCFYPIWMRETTNKDSIVFLDYIVLDSLSFNNKSKGRYVYLRIFEFDNNIICFYKATYSGKINRKEFKDKFFNSILYLPTDKKRRKGINMLTFEKFAYFIGCLIW